MLYCRPLLIASAVVISACQSTSPPMAHTAPTLYCPPELLDPTSPQSGSHNPLASWMTLYLAYEELSEDELNMLTREARRYRRTAPGPRADLALATLLAQRASVKDWKEARQILDQMPQIPDEALYAKWLEKTLLDKEKGQAAQHELANRNQQQETENQLLKVEIDDLKQKIEALTTIEQDLIEQQTDAPVL